MEYTLSSSNVNLDTGTMDFSYPNVNEKSQYFRQQNTLPFSSDTLSNSLSRSAFVQDEIKLSKVKLQGKYNCSNSPKKPGYNGQKSTEVSQRSKPQEDDEPSFRSKSSKSSRPLNLESRYLPQLKKNPNDLIYRENIGTIGFPTSFPSYTKYKPVRMTEIMRKAIIEEGNDYLHNNHASKDLASLIALRGSLLFSSVVKSFHGDNESCQFTDRKNKRIIS